MTRALVTGLLLAVSAGAPARADTLLTVECRFTGREHRLDIIGVRLPDDVRFSVEEFRQLERDPISVRGFCKIKLLEPVR